MRVRGISQKSEQARVRLRSQEQRVAGVIVGVAVERFDGEQTGEGGLAVLLQNRAGGEAAGGGEARLIYGVRFRGGGAFGGLGGIIAILFRLQLGLGGFAGLARSKVRGGCGAGCITVGAARFAARLEEREQGGDGQRGD